MDPKEYTILLAEDMASSRDLYEDELGDAGYKVLSAVNGAEAIEMMRNCPVDLVVTDAKMPEMNALDMIPHIRERHPGVPIIIVTAYPALREAFENESYRVEAFFLKPVVMKDLLGKIAELLEGKAPESLEQMH